MQRKTYGRHVLQQAKLLRSNRGGARESTALSKARTSNWRRHQLTIQKNLFRCSSYSLSSTINNITNGADEKVSIEFDFIPQLKIVNN